VHKHQQQNKAEGEEEPWKRVRVAQPMQADARDSEERSTALHPGGAISQSLGGWAISAQKLAVYAIVLTNQGRVRLRLYDKRLSGHPYVS